MDQGESPRRSAGLISQLFFIWLVPLFQLGFRRTLELKDLYRVLPEDKSGRLGDALEVAWNDQLRKQKESIKTGGGKVYQPSLTKALVKVYGASFASYGVYAFYEECVLKILQPICLGFLLEYFKTPDDYEVYTGWLLGGCLVLLSIIYTSSDHPYTFAVQHIGMKARLSLCAILYRKALRMSKGALEERTTGQIVNFLASDMARFDLCLTYLHYIWVAPLQLFLVLLVLFFYLEIGWPCLVGTSLLIFFIPFQGIMGRVFSRLRSETATKTDRRLILMEEVIGAIRVIKMYAWEEMFEEALRLARRSELRALRRTAYSKALNQSLFYVSSRLVLFITLLTYVLLGNELTSEIVFVSLALYNSVQTVMTLYFPAGVAATAEALVAVRRFQEFLLLEEYERRLEDKKDEAFIPQFEHEVPSSYREGDILSSKPHLSRPTHRKGKKVTGRSDAIFPYANFGIHAKNMTAQWNPESRDMAFSNISFDVKQGEIIAVIGPVGAGKGSVLQAILRELEITSGELEVKGRIGYVSQEAWIFPGTVRENIIFGKEFQPEWYEEVTEACALTKDLNLLPYGDHTLVGDRGTSLSGGQKARINLARAVYADVEIYLLDDPLSAVDAEVSRHLVEKCIFGILRNKARVLVTHQLQYLPSMNQVILLIYGRVTFQGSYDDLVLSGIPFADILVRKFPLLLSSRQSCNSHPNHRAGSSIQLPHPSHTASSTLILDNSGKAAMMPDAPNYYSEGDTPGFKEDRRKLPTDPHLRPVQVEEELGSGGLRLQLYWAYLTADSSCFQSVFIVLIAIVTQVAFTCTDFWLQFWIEAEEKLSENRTEEGDSLDSGLLFEVEKDREAQIYIYSALVLMLFILCLVRSIYFYRLCMRSSAELHRKLFTAVLLSPMAFFESNPIGRILNRFAKDIGVLDESLPPVLFDTIEIFLQTLGVVVIVSSTSWIMLIPAVVMAILFYCIRKFYFHTARAIKRLEGVARSPLFSHISTTLNGLTTIRAFGAEAIFQKQFEDLLDIHSSVWYLFLACSRWLGIVVDWIAILFVTSVLLNFLSTDSGDAEVGLALTSATMLTSMLQWGLRQSAELENQMISVERVTEYCGLEPEAALRSNSHPPPDWPPRGEIHFQNLSLKYEVDSPSLVLKNINCCFRAGEKVGVVGRTGAGKSSLLAVLFRLVEPSEGFIEIDGIITTSIGLHDLRSRMSIIPQEPVLFLGSIRKNLDPFCQFSDLEVWDVLKEVNLEDAVKDLPEGLYAHMLEGGSNFSVGQKQLFCLARAILQNNQILVLDEATANVDPETDGLIQNSIRRNFGDCTVITIAHRLQTVMDSDRILVLDAGQILEFDEPETLLLDRESSFYQLVSQSGKGEADKLLYSARLASARRKAQIEEDDDDEDEDDQQ